MTIKLDELARASQRVASELGVHLDANETALFARQLEYVFKQPFNVEYPELKARQFVPVDYSVPNGAESHTYYQFDTVGEADYVNDYSTDFPNGDVLGKKFTAGIKGIGSSYQYTIQELRAAQMASFNYLEIKSTNARRMIENKLDALVAFGDANALVGGFLKDSAGTAIGTAVTPATPAWNAAATDAEIAVILADLQSLCKSVWVNTKQIHTADTLLLSTACYAKLAYTKLNQYSDKSLLQYVQGNIAGLKSIEPWVKLDGAGTSGKDLAFAYHRDPRVLGLIISQEFEQFTPQNRNLAFMIPCHLRSGGVVWRYPKAASRQDCTL